MNPGSEGGAEQELPQAAPGGMEAPGGDMAAGLGQAGTPGATTL